MAKLKIQKKNPQRIQVWQQRIGMVSQKKVNTILFLSTKEHLLSSPKTTLDGNWQLDSEYT